MRHFKHEKRLPKLGYGISNMKRGFRKFGMAFQTKKRFFSMKSIVYKKKDLFLRFNFGS
jgi:hypothetical protein